MKKKTIILTTISCLVALIPMLIGLILWDKLPDQMATSFGFNGEINGYSSKFFAVVGLPLILVSANILCIVIAMADPRRKNISDSVLAIILAIIPLCSIFAGALMYQEYLGYNISVSNFAPTFLGLLFVVIGLILPKCKQNYTVGIKVPWTLHSEDNWNKTHAFGGKLWVIGGAIMTVLGLLGFETTVFVGVFALAIAPMVYSYVYYRKNERRKEND